MEVDGREFLRNVDLEKDKLKEAEQEKLMRKMEQPSQRQNPNPSYFEKDDDGVTVELSDQALNGMKNNIPQDDEDPDEHLLRDIVLDNDKSNGNNKKKYIILGFALIILFVLTIVIIRVVSNNSTQDELQKETMVSNTPKAEEKLDKIETAQEYKELITKNQDKLIVDQPEPVIEKKEIILPEPIKEKPPVEIKVEKPVEQKPKDIFGIKEQQTSAPEPKVIKPVEQKPKPVVKKEVKQPVKNTDQPKRKVVVPTPVETNFAKKSATKPEGYFIQVGAFSKKPSDTYLNNLSKKGYNYTIYSVQVKGKNYNKVLIGPYPTKAVAQRNLSNVRKDSKNSKAYVLKF